MESESSGFDALRARLFLMFGGPLGHHLVYLHEPLEAYIYFATFGLFLVGAFYDALTLNSLVAAQKKEKAAGAIDINREAKIASTSFRRFIAQFLFGYWIAFLFSLACILLVGSEHRTLLALVVAAGVTQGVYVVGNCRKQQRSFIYIAISAVISSFMAMVLFDLSLYRTILFTTISATFVGNRSAKPQSFQKFSHGTYFALSLIHSCVIVIITIGLLRVVLDRRISVVTGNNYSRVTTSVGSIIRDRYFRNPPKDVFGNFARIEYLQPQHKTVLDTSWKSSWLSQALHQNKNSDEYGVFDYLTVLVVDFMRYSSTLSRKIKKEGPSALQLAVWRTFALQVLSVTPYASDEKLQLECSKYLKSKKGAEGSQKDSNHWQYKAIKKACELLHLAAGKS